LHFAGNACRSLTQHPRELGVFGNDFNHGIEGALGKTRAPSRDLELALELGDSHGLVAHHLSLRQNQSVGLAAFLFRRAYAAFR
tara:strand:- start:5727 stop:5978 length:252 start_codon:yes stop_codon:yes gene_type:complete